MTDGVWVEHALLSSGQRVLVGIGKAPGMCSPLKQTSVWLVLEAFVWFSSLVFPVAKGIQGLGIGMVLWDSPWSPVILQINCPLTPSKALRAPTSCLLL